MSSAKWRPFCPGLNELTFEVPFPNIPHCNGNLISMHAKVPEPEGAKQSAGPCNVDYKVRRDF